MEIYFYKMTTDSGGAPCAWKGLLSLAICKPRIRSAAKKGDLIFGFGGSQLEGRLIYVARVTDKPEPGDYYRKARFRFRPDCIYRDAGGRAVRRSRAKFHFETDERKRDVGKRFERAFVLLSNDFRYFGVSGTSDFRRRLRCIAKALRRLTQGHRINHSAALRAELLQLARELWSRFPRRVNGRPTDEDRARRCNTESRSGQC